MGSVDCSYALARQLQIHIDSEKRPFLTLWKWFSNRNKRRERAESGSVVLISNGHSGALNRFPVDYDFHQNKLIDADLTSVVPLPEDIDVNEWYATQTIFLFDCINVLFGCLLEFCTPTSCPTMSGPANIQYFWTDERGKKGKQHAAHQYIDLVTSYVSACIKDETIFPTKYGNPFPPTYQQTVKNIHRLLCHVLVHIHHAHVRHLKVVDLSAHYTTVLQHFLLFNKTFSLANEADLALFEGVHKALNAPPIPPTVVGCCSSSPPNQSGGGAGIGGRLGELPSSSSSSSSSSSFPSSLPSSAVAAAAAKDDDDSSGSPEKFVPVFTIVT